LQMPRFYPHLVELKRSRVLKSLRQQRSFILT